MSKLFIRIILFLLITINLFSQDKKNKKPSSTHTKAEKKINDFSIINNNDELPFLPPSNNKRKNIFGNKKKKDKLLDKLEYRIGFITEAGFFNNADLRNLNELNSTAIDQTDDKLSLALSRFYINLYFPISNSLFFRIDLFKNGFWGNDNLSGSSTNNLSSSTTIGADPFYFGELFLEKIIFSLKNSQLSIKLGRQFFTIGGTPILQDYMFSDYLDAITFQYNHKIIGNFKVIAIDIFQMGSNTIDQINYLRYLSNDNSRMNNFNGDVNVVRTGFVYESPNLLNFSETITKGGLQNRLYSFYARYGATDNGGANRTNNGSTGNFSDNDWSFMAGDRITYYGSLIDIYLDFAVSTGIDRRLPTASNSSHDINNDGFALNLGTQLKALIINDNYKLSSSIQVFYSMGPRYDDKGNQISHGFVSFKSNQVGGLLLNRYWGMHPSAYTANNGIESSPHDYERKSGTMFIQANLNNQLGDNWNFIFDIWYFMDTATTAFDTSNALGKIEQVQQRLTKPLGMEIDFTINLQTSEEWSIFLTSAVFIPSNFYQTPGITDASPYGTDSFWGLQIGSKLVF